MSSVQTLREFINERLTAAAAEIFTVFQQTIVQYEEEIDRQRKLLQITQKPQIKLPKKEFLQHNLGHHKTSSSLEQEEYKAPHIKEEEDAVPFRQALQTFSPIIPPYAALPPHTVVNGASSWAFTPTAGDAQRSRGKKSPPELFKQETNFCLNQEKPEPPQKEEPGHQECKEDQEEPEPSQLEDHQELGSSQEDQLILKVEGGSSMVPSNEEQSFLSEPQEEPDIEQFFSHDSEVHHVNKHLHSESSFNAKLKIINTFHSDGVNVVPVSEKQDEGEKLLGEKICQNVETVTNKKKKVCEICGRSYAIPQNLVVHMRIHTGEKPYACETCGKSFCQQNGLLRHMRTHTGEKPYSCRTCGKSFSQRCNLLVHDRTHTGEKPYSCVKCVKRFTNRRSLLRHEKAHEIKS